MVKLGVNIDHVATLRQARKEIFPDITAAAEACEKGGADGIVVHLREDRRHIQDKDIYELRKSIKTKLDLEMAATREMLGIALEVKPEMVTLVPEKRKELTTEGGLDVVTNFDYLKPFITSLEDHGIRVSLFVDPISDQIHSAAHTGATFIEIHTGQYAAAKKKVDQETKLKEIAEAVKLAKELGLRVNAGHGLDYENVHPIAEIEGVEELNIGFSIIVRALFVGLESAVREMKDAIRKKIKPRELKGLSELEKEIEEVLTPIIKFYLDLSPVEQEAGLEKVMERVMIRKIMQVVEGQETKAAEVLGISRNTLRKRLTPPR